MHILISSNTALPVTKYGGGERITWWLGEELTRLGHRVTFLTPLGTHCNFARVIIHNPAEPLEKQIPDDVDVLHLFAKPADGLSKPYIVMNQGNRYDFEEFDRNTIFVSKNHAARFGSDAYVYNGLKLEDYGQPSFTQKRTHLHFLAKAAWRIKNVKGAIEIARQSHNKLAVMGGTRLNIKMGFRFTPYASIRFYGMIGGEEKNRLMQTSKGLLFPVLWHEPFGVAIIESLFMGCPVFGTPYGSLPELVPAEVGFLSNIQSELVEEVEHAGRFRPKQCSEYVADNFTIQHTAQKYLQYYEMAMNNQPINRVPPKLKEAEPRFLPFWKGNIDRIGDLVGDELVEI